MSVLLLLSKTTRSLDLDLLMATLSNSESSTTTSKARFHEASQGQSSLDRLNTEERELSTLKEGRFLQEVWLPSPPEDSFESNDLSPLDQELLGILQKDPLFNPLIELRLKIIRPLGQGGMGRVFLAHDRLLKRRVALKLLKKEKESSEKLKDRFIREFKITANLDHPAIPPVYEAGKTPEGTHFLSMQLISGETLKQRLQPLKGKRRTPALCRPFLVTVLRVCEAVAYAHSKGIIHRDLKPSNIMLGRFGEVFVMDWGLADDLRGTFSSKKIKTKMGEVLGSYGYMPPEQAAGEKPDERADVFAVGAILYKILTDQAPITGNNKAELLANTIHGEIQEPRALNKEVPPEINSLVMLALQRNREQRFQSIEELMVDLRAFLAGETVSCHSAETKREGRGKTPWLLPLILLSLLLVGALAALAGLLNI